MEVQQTNQAQVFQGGPGLDPTENNSNPQNPNSASATTTPPVEAPKVTGPIYIGGKKFDSMEELASYTSDLQTKVDSRPFQPAPVEVEKKQKPSDLLFSDPDEFVRQIKSEAVQEATGMISQRIQVDNSWKKFYEDNKDLVDHKDFVSFKLDEIKRKYPDLPADQGMVMVAQQTRSYISKVRGTPQNGSVVPSGPAVVAATSNGTAVTQIPVTRIDESFVAQVRRMRKKG